MKGRERWGMICNKGPLDRGHCGYVTCILTSKLPGAPEIKDLNVLFCFMLFILLISYEIFICHILNTSHLHKQEKAVSWLHLSQQLQLDLLQHICCFKAALVTHLKKHPSFFSLPVSTIKRAREE